MCVIWPGFSCWVDRKNRWLSRDRQVAVEYWTPRRENLSKNWADTDVVEELPVESLAPRSRCLQYKNCMNTVSMASGSLDSRRRFLSYAKSVCWVRWTASIMWAKRVPRTSSWARVEREIRSVRRMGCPMFGSEEPSIFPSSSDVGKLG